MSRFTYEEALDIKAEVAALRVSCDELERKADEALIEHQVLVYADVRATDHDMCVVVYEVDCSTDVVN